MNPSLSPRDTVNLHLFYSRGGHCIIRLYRRSTRPQKREKKSSLRYLHLRPPQKSPHQPPSPITTSGSQIPAWSPRILIRPQKPANTRTIQTHPCRSRWSRDRLQRKRKLKPRMNTTTTVKVRAKPTPSQRWLNRNPVLSRMTKTTRPLLLQLRDPAVHGRYGGCAIRVWGLSCWRRLSLPL